MDDDRIREALDAWRTPEPPGGFADGVERAREADATLRAARRSPRRIALGLGLVAAVVLVIALGRHHVEVRAAQGALEASSRTELSIGTRGVAVAEVGAKLHYRVDASGRAQVSQDAGEVFYRVRHGGPFVVTTPAGTVTVRGTCFYVEVGKMATRRQVVAAAAAGAVIGSAVTVAVIEGRVWAESGGSKVTLAAGEAATMKPGAAPERVAVTTVPRTVSPGVSVARANANADARMSADRRAFEAEAKVAKLTAKVKKLEDQLREAKLGYTADGRSWNPGKENWVDPSQAELVDRAKDCQLLVDIPIGTVGKPRPIPGPMARNIGMSESEIDAYNALARRYSTASHAKIAAIYVAATGDVKGARTMSVGAMESEIYSKAPKGMRFVAQQEVSAELAGLARPPADPRTDPPLVRLTRYRARIGDRFEADLGKVIGADRAHAIRKKNNGWGMKTASEGCPGDDQ